jgi:hypothetical protein
MCIWQQQQQQQQQQKHLFIKADVGIITIQNNLLSLRRLRAKAQHARNER